MKANPVQFLPFPGWPSIWTRIASIGAAKFVGALVGAAGEGLRADDTNPFGSSPVHNWLTHGQAVRMGLYLLLDAKERLSGPWEYTDRDSEQISLALQEIGGAFQGGLARKYAVPSRCNEDVRISRLASQSWIQAAILKHRNLSHKYEFARAWRLLRSDRTRSNWSRFLSRPPLYSAFDSLEDALVVNMLMYRRWYSSEPLRMFTGSSVADRFKHVEALNTSAAHAAVGQRRSIERYGRTDVDSPFARDPILRLPDGAWIVPDPSLLLATVEYRVLRRALTEADSNSSTEAVIKARGAVFEGHVDDCLRCIAAASFPQVTDHIPPFLYGPSKGGMDKESPDGALRSVNPLTPFVLVEAKAHNIPSCSFRDRNDPIEQFRGWLAGVFGAKDGRHPLEQGTRFLADWKGGDPDIVRHYGPWPPTGGVVYLVVVPHEPPAAVHWHAAQGTLLAGRLGTAERDLLKKTVVVSVHGLEVLAAVCEHLRKRGATTDPVAELVDFHGLLYAAGAGPFQEESQLLEGLPTLVGHLMAKYPDAANDMPEFMLQAFLGSQEALVAYTTGDGKEP